MNRKEAEQKTCPLKFTAATDRHGDTYSVDYFCNPENCMMWIDEKKSGNTTYIGGCGLKTGN